MAIPGIPQNFYITSGNQQILCQWALSPGATSYDVQRSTDNITFTSIATPAATSYLDTTVALGTQYYYKVAAVNGDGTSSYTLSQSEVATISGELTLGQIRLQSQQTADRVNSNFVTLPEWNGFINQAMFELYDLLVTTYSDYFLAPAATFITNGSSFYNLPDGVTEFIDENNQTFVPRPFYKLSGVDLGLNTAQNAWVTLNQYNWIDRNKYVYPNSSSTIYGVYNCQYRLMGNKIQFIPLPSSAQTIRLWYVPRLRELLQDTDTTDIGISGWLRYVVVRAAKYALDKEESDSSKLDQELLYLKERIQTTAPNRDQGQGDKISDTRQQGAWGAGFGPEWSGSGGGW